ncbi:MFS transporter [Streptomyces atroolivaceus]|uniref:MFS transporter n=1 Tax=Streptomyces atroolivaceus TaxID=66869 RepID=A0ABV9VI74_STRAZ|nr:MFS transporter [Streptomyces atroolivaceus]
MSDTESEFGDVVHTADLVLVSPEKHEDGAGEPVAPSPQRTSRRGVAAILVAMAGNAAATLMPPLVALPIYVEKFDSEDKATSLGVALGLNALLLLFLTPIFGALSDRTTSPLGMRKPGLIAGTAIIVLGLVVQGLASGVGTLILGTLVMALGQAAFTASFSALIPDQVAPTGRGRVLGFQSLVLVVVGVSASFVGPVLLDHQLLLFTVGGGIAMLTTLAAVVLLDDRVLDKRNAPNQPPLRALVEGFAYHPKSAPDFSWVWLSRFLVTLGISFGGFSIYFLTDQLNVTDDELPSLISLSAVINLGGTVIGTLLGAFLADKLGRLKSLVIFTGLIFLAGGLIAAFSPTVPVFLLATGVIAVAIGSFLPIDGALVMAVLPGGQAQTGKYMAIITIADQLPRSVGPFLAPVVVAVGAATPLGGYPLLYLFMGVVAVAGGLVVRKVRNVR